MIVPPLPFDRVSDKFSRVLYTAKLIKTHDVLELESANFKYFILPQVFMLLSPKHNMANFWISIEVKMYPVFLEKCLSFFYLYRLKMYTALQNGQLAFGTTVGLKLSKTHLKLSKLCRKLVKKM